MSDITATASLPPSVTIFNTAYDRPWTEEETRLLTELVGQQQLAHHNASSSTASAPTKSDPATGIADTQTTLVATNTSSSSMPSESHITIDTCITNPFKINWIPISMKLGRATTSLIKQYNLMKQATYKHGAFTNTEDVHIIKRYLEWMCVYKVSTKAGIWSLLERELNRKDKRISERWRHVLCKRLATMVPLDAENNIIDPIKALAIWRKHREDAVSLTRPSVHNHHSASDSNSNSNSNNSSTNNATTSVSVENDSVLKKRAYSGTDSITSGNSLETTGTIPTGVQPNNYCNAGPTSASSTTDSPMNDINYLLQSINNAEYTNNSVLSIGNSVYDDYVYGGSMWNTIENNNNHIGNTGEHHLMQHANTVENDNAFSSSVWNSITSALLDDNKRPKRMTRWTEEQDDRLHKAVSLFPRDWVKISEYMGMEESSSKCRKRWARLQQKYEQSLSTALQDATNCCFEAGGPENDPDGDPEWEFDLEPDSDSEHRSAELSFRILDEDVDADDMELYRDLQDIGGDLGL